ncbi:Protein of unknown function [Pyronema omphalodes CBS 100304]|uniref:Uncharacterized protein n=1 Tax=Pyronema omphalodes (strain CBS 100304) TaxID=1076935 RepID=U4KX17_PYROM|nr:Protein of unknown function [Pyronema omphalodes CBS 100304]
MRSFPSFIEPGSILLHGAMVRGMNIVLPTPTQISPWKSISHLPPHVDFTRSRSWPAYSPSRVVQEEFPPRLLRFIQPPLRHGGRTNPKNIEIIRHTPVFLRMFGLRDGSPATVIMTLDDKKYFVNTQTWLEEPLERCRRFGLNIKWCPPWCSQRKTMRNGVGTVNTAAFFQGILPARERMRIKKSKVSGEEPWVPIHEILGR